jgi:hypothetical protein
MYALIRSNIATNLLFYRRNRLLVAATTFIVVLMVIFSIPGFLFSSKTQHLELLKQILHLVTGFATILTCGLGLMLVSQHIRDRSVKMVFTKPCLPEVWLLSSFLSAGLVAAVLYAFSLLLASILSVVWGIPFQTGIFFIVLNSFFQAMSLMAFATFLSVVLHPVLALFFLLIFQEGFFYQIKVLLMGGITTLGAGTAATALKIAKTVVDVLYMLWPTFSPYETKMVQLSSSLRGADVDWTYLALAIVYAIVLTALFYFLTDYVLKRKRYI